MWRQAQNAFQRPLVSPMVSAIIELFTSGENAKTGPRCPTKPIHAWVLVGLSISPE